MKLLRIDNIIQKSFLTLMLVLLIMGLFLSNPLGGYEIPNAYGQSTPCNDSEKLKYKLELESLKRSGIRMTNDPALDDQFIDEMTQKCVNLASVSLAPISEWRSKDPFLAWFGSAVNLLSYVIAVVVTGVAAIAIFQSRTVNE